MFFKKKTDRPLTRVKLAIIEAKWKFRKGFIVTATGFFAMMFDTLVLHDSKTLWAIGEVASFLVLVYGQYLMLNSKIIVYFYPDEIASPEELLEGLLKEVRQ